MLIALASPTVATCLDHGLDQIRQALADAASRGATIVSFPEAYLPGLRGQDFEVFAFDPPSADRALGVVRDWARSFRIAVILSMEKHADAGRQITAYVIDAQGRLLGDQTKNQIDPSEDCNYVPGCGRRLFEVNGLKCGVAICHEGWRYPETVRWAAMRGAHIVFHPQHTGSMSGGRRLRTWGAAENPYYERAMMMRSIENSVYFASVNYALPFPESATSLISPTGECLAHLPYGVPGVLVHDIDLALATGHLARRFAPERYKELG